MRTPQKPKSDPSANRALKHQPKPSPVEGATNVHLEQIQHDYAGRCGKCYMRQEKCICAHIPQIRNNTKLTVIMHHRESHKTTNTARLAHLSLINSQIVLRGLPNQPVDFAPLWDANTEIPLFLTLSEKSVTLSQEFLKELQTQNPGRKFHLIVPDGSWRQASKVGKREKSLQEIPWIKLPPGPPSRYLLRHEHLEEGMATLEAIARAYGIIEDQKIQQSLEEIFDLMVERTLETRPSNHPARLAARSQKS